MSARLDLEWQLALSGLEPAEAHRMLDAYAHELAEKQRADIDYESGNTTPDFIAGRLSGADLIDPEVSCSSGCSCVCHAADPSPCDDCSGVSDSGV